ncbi:MAG: tripartite tricarboxylate transporter substrate binding protein [Candidatus Omnitrophica bacterium]|nr:tripartite tricarboxylate transporter substrate binding protein [Candidatus Omnitrophota bacterium]
MNRGLLIVICMGIVTACSPTSQEFPSKPITVIVPWEAGGGTDSLARAFVNEAAKVFPVPFTVVNRAGGSGAIGHSSGMTARPDGYTVTMITFELCSYKPLKRAEISYTGFKPVIQINEDPAAITVRADSPWTTLSEFLDYARAHPKEVTVGNSGPGAVWHLGALRLEKLAGVEFTHIPHDGAKPAVTQLLGGHIAAVAVSPAEVLQYTQTGTLRCLGIMSESRFPELPDVPTFREQGIDLVHGTWRGLAVPKQTPDEIVAKLEAGFKETFDSPEFQKAAQTALLGLRYRGSAEFTEFLQSESETIAALLEHLEL